MNPTPIIKLVAGLGAAAVAYFAADKVVKKKTGKHIHQHAFEWWCGLRDKVLAWCHKNNHYVIKHIVMLLDDAVTTTYRTRRLRVNAKVEGRTRAVKITEEQLTADQVAELMKQRPEFQKATTTAKGTKRVAVPMEMFC